MTLSAGTLSDHALSSGAAIPNINQQLSRLAQSLSADAMVIVEIVARENVSTEFSQVIRDGSDTFLVPLSGGTLSSLTVPQEIRERTSFLFSTTPWCGAPDDALYPNARAVPRLENGGRITRVIPIEATNRRRGTRTIGDVAINNADGAFSFLLTDYTLEGGTIKAWLAEQGSDSSEWALVYEATIDRVSATREEIRVSITTIADELERTIQIGQFTGGGGLAGDANVAGRRKPILFGEVFGFEPILSVEADNIYALSDGSIQAVDFVCEGGLLYNFTADYENIELLAGATLALGEYATCLAEGLIRIGISLDGLVYPLRVGAKGDNTANGYVSDTGEILYRIARNRAFIPGNSIDLATFQSLPASTVGYYLNGSSDVTCATVFNDLLGGVVGYYGTARTAKLSVGRILGASNQSPKITIRDQQVVDDRVEQRADRLRISQPFTYAPTWDPLTADQISPLADASLADRLQKSFFESERIEDSDLAISPRANPVLTTYFIDLAPAFASAGIALDIAAASGLPLQSDIGRRGLEVDLGEVIEIEDSFWKTGYRGVIYEQEDDLGAVIGTRVTAIG